MLFAGVYVLRSEEELDGLIDEDAPDGLFGLFCALETLSFALTLGVVVLIPLLEGLTLPAGLALPDGLSGDTAPFLFVTGTSPAEEGREPFVATCNPPPFGLVPFGCSPLPPGCGELPPG